MLDLLTYEEKEYKLSQIKTKEGSCVSCQIFSHMLQCQIFAVQDRPDQADFFFFGDRPPSILIFFSFQKSLFDLIHLEGGEVAEY